MLVKCSLGNVTIQKMSQIPLQCVFISLVGLQHREWQGRLSSLYDIQDMLNCYASYQGCIYAATTDKVTYYRQYFQQNVKENTHFFVAWATPIQPSELYHADSYLFATSSSVPVNGEFLSETTLVEKSAHNDKKSVTPSIDHILIPGHPY